jgi:hypothetical protein
MSRRGLRRQRPASLRPAVECLENRTLLSSSAMLPTPGLTVLPLDTPAAPVATHLGISLSANPTTVGAPMTATLIALDASNHLVVGYAGAVHFTSTDGNAVLPADYTFVPGDNGVHTFDLTFNSGGSQTVTATDTLTSSITGSAGLTVNNPVPTITTLGTTTATEGAAGITLTVNGTNFVSTSVVQWNGQPLATTFVNGTQLSAALPAADLAEEGTFSVTVANPTPGGGTSAAQTFTIADAALTVANPAISPVEGAAFNGVVATFTDAGGPETPAPYQVMIDWGDGTAATAGTVSVGQGGVLQVTGKHTYAEEGSFAVKVTVQDDGTTATATGTATVGDAPLTVTPKPITPTEGRAFSGPVATFTDAGGPEDVSTYKVMIDWGDGTAPTAGTVSAGQGGVFQVTGGHTYAEEGHFTVKVTVQDDATTATATGTAAVADVPLTGSPGILKVMEGASFSTTVALFRDADPGAAVTDYHATVNWGDGSPVDSKAVISALAGQGYLVTGKHRYAWAGSYQITVQVQDGSSSPLTLHGRAEVTDAPLRAVPKAVLVPQGETAVNVAVAAITDTGGVGPLQNYSAWINWGDGTPVAPGTVTRSAGTLVVTGSHTFATPGRFSIAVTFRDKGGNSVGLRTSAVVGSADERFVAQLYRDLLHRPVDGPSLATWTRLLAQGVTHERVARDIEMNREYLADVVQGQYQTYLHRSADLAGLYFGIQTLVTGGTDEQVAATLIGSPEYYQARGGGTVGGFLSALYQDVLGQAIDPASQAFFSGELGQGVSRRTVALQVLTSNQAEKDLVQSLYLRYLHRPADAAGLSAYVKVLQLGGHDEDVIAALVGTPDYTAKL